MARLHLRTRFCTHLRWHAPRVVRALGAALGMVLLLPVALPLAVSAAPAAAMAAPKAYVGLFKDDAVAVLDTGTNQVLRTIPVPPGPHGLVATPDGRTVFVSSDGASTVSAVDTTTDQVVASIEVGQAPHGLAITTDGSRVLAAVFGAGQVATIDVASRRVVAQVPVPSPHNIAISPDGRTAYVASQQPDAPSLAILDLANQIQAGSVPLDKVPRALSYSPDGAQLSFTQAGVDAVQVLDVASNQIVAQVPVGASPPSSALYGVRQDRPCREPGAGRIGVHRYRQRVRLRDGSGGQAPTLDCHYPGRPRCLRDE